jgi:hypothetical protein
MNNTNEATNRNGVDLGALLWGLTLIALGVVFLFDQFEWWNMHGLTHRYWPMIIVVLGFSRMLRGRFWPGLWLTIIGAWLQISQLGLYGLTFRNSWPVLLIGFGLYSIAKTIAGPRGRRGWQGCGGVEQRHD